MNMLSSMARSPQGKELLKFMGDASLSETWEDPLGHNVKAFISGRVLDNQNPAKITIDGKANNELLVHLESIQGEATINLNTLLALATAYARDQYKLANLVVEHFKDDE